MTKAELGGLSKIAGIYGVSRQLVNYWASMDGFPSPEQYLGSGKAGGRLWSLAKVDRWAQKHGHERVNGDGDGSRGTRG